MFKLVIGEESELDEGAMFIVRPWWWTGDVSVPTVRMGFSPNPSFCKHIEGYYIWTCSLGDVFARWGSGWTHYVINWPANSRAVFWSEEFQAQLNTAGPIQECWMPEDSHNHEVVARAEYCGFKTRTKGDWLVISR